MKKFLSLALVCVMLFSCMTAVFADEAKTPATFIYVAENGDDSAAGTVDAPLKTIAAAVKAAEGISGTVVVNLRGGAYQMTDTIALNDANSDLVIRAYAGEDVLVTGGTVLPYSAFKPCTDEAFLEALSAKSAKSKIVSANIKDLGVENLGELRRQGFASGGGDDIGYAPTLTYNEDALTLARYPNEGYLYTATVIRSGADGEVIEGTSSAAEFEYTFGDSRLKNWSWKDVWNVGYFKHDWSDLTAPAKYNEKANSVVSMVAKSYSALPDRRVFFINVPEELDMPGEWYLNRETGVLYLVPVDGMKAEDTLVYTSFNKNFFELDKAKNVKFIGIKFNGTCQSAIRATNCDTIVIDDCEFTGIGDSAVHIEKCFRSGVQNSYFHDLGSRGVYLVNNGDRVTLTSGECFVTNCHIETFSQYLRTYSPAVHVNYDVGTVVSYNEIHDAPHFAIRYEGNDIIIEYNDFYDVCQDTADTGAVYTGRRWDTRGNEIRYNYFHDMTEVQTNTGMEKMGVYLDDMSSSTNVHGNVFFNIDSVALIGGGRYNQFNNNIMVNCKKPLVFDERGLTWQYTQGWLDPSNDNSLYKLLEKLPYKEGIWNEKYPELAGILEDDPLYPKHNVLKNNILYQTPEFNLASSVQEYSTIENNIEISKTFEFVDYRNKDFTLKDNSEVFTKLPEFENIPFNKIGRYEYTVEDVYVETGSAPAPSAPADSINVLLNGEAINFADVAPQIINDRTMVPLRAIFEALGAEVSWDDATKTVTAKKDDVTIRMTIGADFFLKNDEKVSLDSPATIVDSRTLVPVRAIAESFGSTVGWIAESKTVAIED